MKRKMTETWDDVEYLLARVRGGKYPRGVDFLGHGSGTFISV